MNFERIKLRMARYVLNLGKAIDISDSRAVLEKRIRMAAETSARQKASDLKLIKLADRPKALAERLREMLGDFGEENIQISTKNNAHAINNPVCPCLTPYVSQAKKCGFEPQEVRRFACMICLPSYAKGAQLAGLKFEGKLTPKGCRMSFSKKED